MVNCLWLLRRALGIHTKNKFLISRAHVEMKIKTCAYKKNNMKKVYKTTQRFSCRYRLSISVKAKEMLM